MITNAEYMFIMKHLPVLEDISLDRQLLWAQRTVAVHYSEGVKIQCDDGVGLILIKSGSLRLYLLSQEGREITLYNLQADEVCVISTWLALQIINFEVHIEAASDCCALLMDVASFAEFCEDDACIDSFFVRLLTMRISLAVEALERAFSLNIDQRLAVFLTGGMEMAGSNDVELTHDQIARHIGSTREVVTRALNRFAASGMVKLTRGNVEVLNKEKLDEYNS